MFGRRIWMPSSRWATVSNSSDAARTFAKRNGASPTPRALASPQRIFIRASASRGSSGVSATFPELTTNAARAWGVGPSITWNFPNQAGPRALVRQAQANADAALAGFDAAVLRALKETEQSLSAYGAELDRRQALADAQDKAQKAFDMAHDQFLAGALSNLGLLTTEQSLISS